MATFPHTRISRLLADADAASTNTARGKCLEDAIAALFDALPGVKVVAKNVTTVGNTSEIDLLCWNKRQVHGLYCLETPFLIECKNWGSAVGARAVQTFANTLRTRACRDGILVAAAGITGTAGTIKEARLELMHALRDGARIVVMTRAEIESARKAKDILTLIEKGILDLVVNATKTI